MEYYIQGDAANADKIKAAFEKLGYCTGNLGFTSSQLYYTIEGKVELMCTKVLQNLVKTHPDYKELELPVEPKFKKGDWIACDADSFTLSIKSVKDGNYYFHQGASLPIKDIDEHYHLWTIQDAKDGDVLVDTLSGTRALTILFRFINADDSISTYCGWNGYTFRVTIDGLGYGTLSSTQYVPATEEQRGLLFDKMREAGYQWYAEKKELKKIQPRYDISNFKPKQWVLVRDNDEWEWALTRFSHLSNCSASLFVCINGASFQQCIPLDGNEKLLGTTDMCDEMYVNW